MAPQNMRPNGCLTFLLFDNSSTYSPLTFIWLWVIWLLLLGFDLWPCDLFLSFLLGAILEKCNYFFIYLIFYYFRIWIMAAGQGQGKGKGKGGTGKSSDGGKNKPKSVSRWAQQFILLAKADNRGKEVRLTIISKFSGYFTKNDWVLMKFAWMIFPVLAHDSKIEISVFRVMRQTRLLETHPPEFHEYPISFCKILGHDSWARSYIWKIHPYSDEFSSNTV